MILRAGMNFGSVISMIKLGWIILMVQLVGGGFGPKAWAMPADRRYETGGADADSSELQMIAEHMAGLTGSLQEIPQLPKLDATIVFPERRDNRDNAVSSSPAVQEETVSPSDKKGRKNV